MKQEVVDSKNDIKNVISSHATNTIQLSKGLLKPFIPFCFQIH